MAEVGGCSLALGEGVPVLVLAWPVVTGPEPASRLAVLQGPPKAIVELTAKTAPTSIDFVSMTFPPVCRLMLGGAGFRHFTMLFCEHLRGRHICHCRLDNIALGFHHGDEALARDHGRIVFVL